MNKSLRSRDRMYKALHWFHVFVGRVSFVLAVKVQEDEAGDVQRVNRDDSHLRIHPV